MGIKHIPNIISVIRIICSLLLLFTKTLSVPFFIVYMICGVSDALDGYIARKTKTGSQLGAVLDSIADFIFIGILMVVLLPMMRWSIWMLVWIGLVALIRFVSLSIGLIKYHTIAFLHTYANKATGLLIFFLPLIYRLLGLPITVCLVCSLASLSATEDLIINLTSKKLDRNIKSIIIK